MKTAIITILVAASFAAPAHACSCSPAIETAVAFAEQQGLRALSTRNAIAMKEGTDLITWAADMRRKCHEQQDQPR